MKKKQKISRRVLKRNKRGFFGRLTYEWRFNRYLYLMALPALAALFIFCYLPMFGLIMAFQDYRPIEGVFGSKFVGLDNFKFLFQTTDAWRITRNTVGYNILFISVGMTSSVFLAILLSVINSKRLAKTLQSVYIMPYFLSMSIVALIVFAFLDYHFGFINSIRVSKGESRVNYYTEISIWPYILLLVSQWKSVGYSAVVYLAAISGIDREYYEAAMLDGASKPQQIRYIVLPHLRPMITILLIMNIGNIFRGDFGLFLLIPNNSSSLYEVTDVIDTYVYRAMQNSLSQGMATAAGMYQSVVSFALVLLSNYTVRRIEPDHAMF